MKSRNKSLKTISFFLVFSLLAEQAAFAAPELKALTLGVSHKPALHFKFPASVANIEDAYKAPGSDTTIYLIQDAHTNTSGQINLAKTLDTLFRNEKDLKTVFIEAGSGNDSLDFLKSYSTATERERVGKEWLKKGILHGEEYLNLTSDHKMVLWGVEDMALYEKGVEAYRRTAKERQGLQDYLKTVTSAVESLKPRLMNPALLSFDGLEGRYIKEALPLTDYVEALLIEAGKRGIAWEGYAYLVSLKALKGAESRIDFAKANEEQTKALRGLDESVRAELLELADMEKSPFKFSSLEDKGEKAFYAALRESLGTDATDIFPELYKYFAYVEAAKTLDPKSVLAELKSLELEIESVIARTPDEKRFMQCQRSLRTLRKLFDLTLTPEEYAEYEATAKIFTIERITGFLNKKIMELEMLYERAPFLEEGFDKTVEDAETFYRLTRDRDEAFLKNMMQKMDSDKGPRVAVLIAGGFHAPNLKAMFKSRNISYVSIQPQVLYETNQKRYESILLNQKISQTPLEMAPRAMQHLSRTPMMMNDAINGARFVSEFPNYVLGARLAATVYELGKGQRFVISGNGFKQAVIVSEVMPDMDAIRLTTQGIDRALTVTRGVQTPRNGLKPFDLSIGTTLQLTRGAELTLTGVDGKKAKFDLSNPSNVDIKVSSGARLADANVYDVIGAVIGSAIGVYFGDRLLDGRGFGRAVQLGLLFSGVLVGGVIAGTGSMAAGYGAYYAVSHLGTDLPSSGAVALFFLGGMTAIFGAAITAVAAIQMVNVNKSITIERSTDDAADPGARGARLADVEKFKSDFGIELSRLQELSDGLFAHKDDDRETRHRLSNEIFTLAVQMRAAFNDFRREYLVISGSLDRQLEDIRLKAYRVGILTIDRFSSGKDGIFIINIQEEVRGALKSWDGVKQQLVMMEPRSANLVIKSIEPIIELSKPIIKTAKYKKPATKTIKPVTNLMKAARPIAVSEDKMDIQEGDVVVGVKVGGFIDFRGRSYPVGLAWLGRKVIIRPSKNNENFEVRDHKGPIWKFVKEREQYHRLVPLAESLARPAGARLVDSRAERLMRHVEGVSGVHLTPLTDGSEAARIPVSDRGGIVLSDGKHWLDVRKDLGVFLDRLTEIIRVDLSKYPSISGEEKDDLAGSSEPALSDAIANAIRWGNGDESGRIVIVSWVVTERGIVLHVFDEAVGISDEDTNAPSLTPRQSLFDIAKADNEAERLDIMSRFQGLGGAGGHGIGISLIMATYGFSHHIAAVVGSDGKRLGTESVARRAVSGPQAGARLSGAVTGNGQRAVLKKELSVAKKELSELEKLEVAAHDKLRTKQVRADSLRSQKALMELKIESLNRSPRKIRSTLISPHPDNDLIEADERATEAELVRKEMRPISMMLSTTEGQIQEAAHLLTNAHAATQAQKRIVTEIEERLDSLDPKKKKIRSEEATAIDNLNHLVEAHGLDGGALNKEIAGLLSAASLGAGPIRSILLYLRSAGSIGAITDLREAEGVVLSDEKLLQIQQALFKVDPDAILKRIPAVKESESSTEEPTVAVKKKVVPRKMMAPLVVTPSAEVVKEPVIAMADTEKEFQKKMAAIEAQRAEAQSFSANGDLKSSLRGFLEAEAAANAASHAAMIHAAHSGTGSLGAGVFEEWFYRFTQLASEVGMELEVFSLLSLVERYVENISEDRLLKLNDQRNGSAAAMIESFEESFLAQLPQLGTHAGTARKELRDILSHRLAEMQSAQASQANVPEVEDYLKAIRAELKNESPDFHAIAYKYQQIADTKVLESLQRLIWQWAEGLSSTRKSLAKILRINRSLKLDALLKKEISRRRLALSKTATRTKSVRIDSISVAAPNSAITPVQVTAIEGAVLMPESWQLDKMRALVIESGVKEPSDEALKALFESVAPEVSSSISNGEKMRRLTSLGLASPNPQTNARLLKALAVAVEDPSVVIMQKFRALLARRLKGSPKASELLAVLDEHQADIDVVSRAHAEELLKEEPLGALAASYGFGKNDRERPVSLDEVNLLVRGEMDEYLTLLHHVIQVMMMRRFLKLNAKNDVFTVEDVGELIISGYFDVLTAMWILKNHKILNLTENELLRAQYQTIMTILPLSFREDEDAERLRATLAKSKALQGEWLSYIGYFLRVSPREGRGDDILSDLAKITNSEGYGHSVAALPAEDQTLFPYWANGWLHSIKMKAAMAENSVLGDLWPRVVSEDALHKDVMEANDLLKLVAAYRLNLTDEMPTLELLRSVYEIEATARDLRSEGMYLYVEDVLPALQERFAGRYTADRVDKLLSVQLMLRGKSLGDLMDHSTFYLIDTHHVEKDDPTLSQSIRKRIGKKHYSSKPGTIHILQTQPTGRSNKSLIIFENASKVSYIPQTERSDDILLLKTRKGHYHVLTESLAWYKAEQVLDLGGGAYRIVGRLNIEETPTPGSTTKTWEVSGIDLSGARLADRGELRSATRRFLDVAMWSARFAPVFFGAYFKALRIVFSEPKVRVPASLLDSRTRWNDALPKSWEKLEQIYQHQIRDKLPFVVDGSRSKRSLVATIDRDSSNRPYYFYDLNHFATKSVGENRPEVIRGFIQNIFEVVNRHAYSDFVTPAYVDYIAMMMSIAPTGMDHILLVNSGAEANENAIKAAKLKRPASRFVIAFEGSFHGRTAAAMSATYKKKVREGFFTFDWPFVPYPDTARSTSDEELDRREIDSLHKIWTMLSTGEPRAPAVFVDRDFSPTMKVIDSFLTKPSYNTTVTIRRLRQGLWTYNASKVTAVIIEPYQGEGGIRFASPRFYRRLRMLTAIFDVPLIMDEIQSGMLSTGVQWAHQDFQLPLPPDIVTTAKKAQMGIVYFNDRYFISEAGKLNSTWGGSEGGVVRAPIYDGIIRDEKLVKNILALNEHILDRLRMMRARVNAELGRAMVSEPRGRGLVIALDLTDTATRDFVVQRALRRGLILNVAGDKAIRFLPRYDTPRQDVDRSIEILTAALLDIKDGVVAFDDEGNISGARLANNEDNPGKEALQFTRDPNGIWSLDMNRIARRSWDARVSYLYRTLRMLYQGNRYGEIGLKRNTVDHFIDGLKGLQREGVLDPLLVIEDAAGKSERFIPDIFISSPRSPRTEMSMMPVHALYSLLATHAVVREDKLETDAISSVNIAEIKNIHHIIDLDAANAIHYFLQDGRGDIGNRIQLGRSVEFAQDQLLLPVFEGLPWYQQSKKSRGEKIRNAQQRIASTLLARGATSMLTDQQMTTGVLVQPKKSGPWFLITFYTARRPAPGSLVRSGGADDAARVLEVAVVDLQNLKVLYPSKEGKTIGLDDNTKLILDGEKLNVITRDGKGTSYKLYSPTSPVSGARLAWEDEIVGLDASVTTSTEADNRLATVAVVDSGTGKRISVMVDGKDLLSRPFRHFKGTFEMKEGGQFAVASHFLLLKQGTTFSIFFLKDKTEIDDALSPYTHFSSALVSGDPKTLSVTANTVENIQSIAFERPGKLSITTKVPGKEAADKIVIDMHKLRALKAGAGARLSDLNEQEKTEIIKVLDGVLATLKGEQFPSLSIEHLLSAREDVRSGDPDRFEFLSVAEKILLEEGRSDLVERLSKATQIFSDAYERVLLNPSAEARRLMEIIKKAPVIIDEPGEQQKRLQGLIADAIEEYIKDRVIAIVRKHRLGAAMTPVEAVQQIYDYRYLWSSLLSDPNPEYFLPLRKILKASFRMTREEAEVLAGELRSIDNGLNMSVDDTAPGERLEILFWNRADNKPYPPDDVRFEDDRVLSLVDFEKAGIASSVGLAMTREIHQTFYSAGARLAKQKTTEDLEEGLQLPRLGQVIQQQTYEGRYTNRYRKNQYVGVQTSREGTLGAGFVETEDGNIVWYARVVSVNKNIMKLQLVEKDGITPVGVPFSARVEDENIGLWIWKAPITGGARLAKAARTDVMDYGRIAPGTRGPTYFKVGDIIAVFVEKKNRRNDALTKVFADLDIRGAYKVAVYGGIIYKAKIVESRKGDEGSVYFHYLGQEGREIGRLGRTSVNDDKIAKWKEPVLKPEVEKVQKPKVGRSSIPKVKKPVIRQDHVLSGEFTSSEVAKAIDNQVAAWLKRISMDKLLHFSDLYPLRITLDDKNLMPERIVDAFESPKAKVRYEVAFEHKTGRLVGLLTEGSLLETSQGKKNDDIVRAGINAFNLTYAHDYAISRAALEKLRAVSETTPSETKGARLAKLDLQGWLYEDLGKAGVLYAGWHAPVTNKTVVVNPDRTKATEESLMEIRKYPEVWNKFLLYLEKISLSIKPDTPLNIDTAQISSQELLAFASYLSSKGDATDSSRKFARSFVMHPSTLFFVRAYSQMDPVDRRHWVRKELYEIGLRHVSSNATDILSKLSVLPNDWERFMAGLELRVRTNKVQVLTIQSGVTVDDLTSMKDRLDVPVLQERVVEVGGIRTLSLSISGARLSSPAVPREVFMTAYGDVRPVEPPRSMDNFFRGAGATLPNRTARRIALMEGEALSIYRLEKQPHELWVELTSEPGKRRYVLLESSDETKPVSVLPTEAVFDADLTQLTEDVIVANQQRPSASIGTATKRLYIHLDTFPVFEKSIISSMLFHLNQRVSAGTDVILSGSNEQREAAMGYIHKMGLNRSGQFIEETDLAVKREDVLEAHLVTQGRVTPELKAKYGDTKWLFLQDAGDFEVGVFAFAPVESLLELVAAGQTDDAYDFFRSVTSHKDISKPEFLRLIEGDEDLAARYPISYLEKVDLETAIRAYQLSRIVDIYA